MTAQLPSWPTTPPTYGSVVLRAFTDEDAHLAVELGDDPYIPLIGSLPAHPTAEQALAWIHRQRGQLTERERFSFAIANAESNKAVGAILQLLVSSTVRDRGVGVAPIQATTLHTLAESYATWGLAVTELRPATVADVAAAHSSWGKRLGAGTRRPTWLLRARFAAPSRWQAPTGSST